MSSIDKGLVARQVEANCAAADKQLAHRGVNNWECRRKRLKRGGVAHRDLLELASRNRK